MLVVAAGRGCSFLFLVSSGLRGTHQLSQARGLGRLRSAPGSPARPAARGADQLGLGWVGLDLGAGQCELCCCCCCAGGMRWCGLRLLPLVCLLVIAAAAEEDKTNILQADKNNDNNIAHSDGGKTGRHDETNPNTVHHDEGKNDPDGNNKKDKSTEVISTAKYAAAVHHVDKDINTAKSSHVTDFSQDPLIKGCDPSHTCVIENKKFIACLKVPGEDSLALSLLMDNKGMDPLYVGITTPEFVTSAEDTIHVQANDHNETQVTIFNNGAPNMTIILRVAEETCNISIHRAIAREISQVMPMRLTSKYMLVPVFLLIGAVVACIKLRRRGIQDGGPAYQKLDAAELPLSTGGKKEADQSDQWDDNWGDEWDDEAPLTPTRHMPNLSSKGLASRRSTKDGWKD
ncbi:uncharacterized protein [Oryza sativa Japonica Group]|nr:uncharacterized protein LOC4339673 [Oryza sativa Japonica Group]KAF2932213.1 hypothetical protein DAI22_05g271100 [Oryza sativa Japonica Group]